MPTVRMILTCLFIAFLCMDSSMVLAQNCKLSGTPAWNSMLHNIIADCATSFASPNKRFIFRISTEGAMSLSPIGAEEKKLKWSDSQIVPPAMFSWSPESSVFFINDGDGSGMSSQLRFFKIGDGEVKEEKSIGAEAVLFYRRRVHCSSFAADPNVWGYGWGKQGSEIFLLVQPTSNESCGRPDDFISLVVRISDGKIIESLSKAETEEKLKSLLPSSLFAE